MKKENITVTMPDGTKKEGIAFETTPLNIAEGISKSLAKKAVVAKVAYSRRLGEAQEITAADSEGESDDEDAPSLVTQQEMKDDQGCQQVLTSAVPLLVSQTFWHSSAHVLGQALERKFGVKLCIGPPTEEGFYYDAYAGN
ncbi:thrS1, partial [Symbiodinium sp. KB8]